MNLPICASRELIVETVRNNKVTVVVGETGSGKTTQIPMFLFQAGLVNGGMLGVTQPRKIAAISVAEFVAGQLESRIGEVVGYQIRFDDQTADSTKIKFMTDGILLREMQLDPKLSKYSVIVVDEAHERSQNIDFVMGMLKSLLKKRNDLKVVVTSATIDQEKFSKYFWNAPIINVSGRTYPVEVRWAEKSHYNLDNLFREIAEKVVAIHFQEEPGDVLVFVAGTDQIDKVIEAVEVHKVHDLVLLPAHGGLDPNEQRKIFAAYPGKRKVVVATNVAETSITLDGVAYVIDSGLIKQTHFHPESGIQSLDLIQHSQSGCEQRAGRAGRTQPGICFRMYALEDFQMRPKFTIPEILRTSLANVVLMMEDIGIEEIEQFDFLDQPDKLAFHEAYATLIALGAIKKGRQGLTELGRSMAKMPLEPRVARMVLEAAKHGCTEEVATVAAFLSVRTVFARPKGKEYEADLAHSLFKDPQSDVLTFLTIWKEYVAHNRNAAWCFDNFLNTKALQEMAKIREQLIDILRRNGIEICSKISDSDSILKAVAAGLVYNLMVSGGSHSYDGVVRPIDNVFIHPGSSVFNQFNLAKPIVAAKIMQTTKNYAHTVTVVQPGWLPELVPELCTFGETEMVRREEGQNWVVAIRDILLKCRSIGYLDERKIGREEVKLTLAEAEVLQRQKIRQAEAKGWIPLSFRKIGVGYLDTYMVATYQGQTIKSSFAYAYRIEEGVTYFCELERSDIFWAEVKAVPKFGVLDLTPVRPIQPKVQEPVSLQVANAQPKQPEAMPATNSQLEGLAVKWGGRVKK